MLTHFDIFNEMSRPFENTEESAAYLRQTRERFDVLNLSYWFLGTSQNIPDRLTWLSTYDEGYTAVYMQEFTPFGDPAFATCFSRFLPLDWAELRDASDEARTIHSAAAAFGIGKQGISYPIRDPGFGDAMFSVNMDCADADWRTLRMEIVGVFHLFAHYFHLRMKDVIASRPVTSEYDLSAREREVLAWAAEGKTAWETARLLNVSERAIRLYTENAMSKLRAKTKTQAVAIAVKNAIIQ